ncbi:hypothetical protein C0J52_14867 [Blattella germanica]|nr:hypothetical protein C0J52_14867 [Blattella germanica]
MERWKGSVYKLIWRELVAYLVLYFLINLVYRYALNDTQQRYINKEEPRGLSSAAWDCCGKNSVYKYDNFYVPPLPANLQELRHRIRAAVAMISRDMVEHVLGELDYRTDTCRISKVGHIEHLWLMRMIAKSQVTHPVCLWTSGIHFNQSHEICNPVYGNSSNVEIVYYRTVFIYEYIDSKYLLYLQATSDLIILFLMLGRSIILSQYHKQKEGLFTLIISRTYCIIAIVKKCDEVTSEGRRCPRLASTFDSVSIQLQFSHYELITNATNNVRSPSNLLGLMSKDPIFLQKARSLTSFYLSIKRKVFICEVTSSLVVYKLFEKIRHYFGQQGESIPMSFVLGFYVTLIVKRWWEQYRLLPWPDSLALFVSAAIPGVLAQFNSNCPTKNYNRAYNILCKIILDDISGPLECRFQVPTKVITTLLCQRKSVYSIPSRSNKQKYYSCSDWSRNFAYIYSRKESEGLLHMNKFKQKRGLIVKQFNSRNIWVLQLFESLVCNSAKRSVAWWNLGITEDNSNIFRLLPYQFNLFKKFNDRLEQMLLSCLKKQCFDGHENEQQTISHLPLHCISNKLIFLFQLTFCTLLFALMFVPFYPDKSVGVPVRVEFLKRVSRPLNAIITVLFQNNEYNLHMLLTVISLCRSKSPSGLPEGNAKQSPFQFALAIGLKDEKGRLMRRNIVRYAMLSYVITLQKVSFRVKKRFPTWQHMVDAGLVPKVGVGLLSTRPPFSLFCALYCQFLQFRIPLQDSSKQICSPLFDRTGLVVVRLLFEKLLCEYTSDQVHRTLDPIYTKIISLSYGFDRRLMMESEKKIFEMMDEKSDMSKYWMPLIWATNIINRARQENIIASDHLVQTMLVELSDIRRRLGSLIGYDTVCVPLVYTQVLLSLEVISSMFRQKNTEFRKISDARFRVLNSIQI